MFPVPRKTIARLSVYRRILTQMLVENCTYARSQDIAEHAQVTSAQVRRDIMTLGFKGIPNKGYEVRKLLESISVFMDAPEREEVALVGVGNLGRALLAYLVNRRPNLHLCAAFDVNPDLHGQIIHGCKCHDIKNMEEVMAEASIKVAVLTVPAKVAQEMAAKLVQCKVKGILNFVPVRLQVPDWVYVEDMDISASLERASFFARMRNGKRGIE